MVARLRGSDESANESEEEEMPARSSGLIRFLFPWLAWMGAWERGLVRSQSDLWPDEVIPQPHLLLLLLSVRHVTAFVWPTALQKEGGGGGRGRDSCCPRPRKVAQKCWYLND